MSADIDALATELAVRNLVARYADAIHRRDVEAWRATWLPDAEWELPSLEPGAPPRAERGRESIVALWQQTMRGFAAVMHAVHSGELDLAPGRATGRWYLTEHLVPEGGGGMRIFGVYDDVYGVGDSGWAFARRRFRILYSGPADLSGSAAGFASP